MIMRVNTKGLELIMSLEGCRLKAYKLKGESNYTIGYGHSDKTIKADTVITQAKADALLKEDLKKFEKYVENNTKFELNENQFSALVSYTYNRGYKGFRQLMDNTSIIAELPANIVKYWGSNKNYKDALIKRRKKEQALFIEPVNRPVSNVSRETIAIPTPTLRRGSKGSKVYALQIIMTYWGCNLKPDGIFGENTYRVICDFQKKNNLVIDGVYGPHTYNTLRDIMRGKYYGN